MLPSVAVYCPDLWLDLASAAPTPCMDTTAMPILDLLCAAAFARAAQAENLEAAAKAAMAVPTASSALPLAGIGAGDPCSTLPAPSMDASRMTYRYQEPHQKAVAHRCQGRYHSLVPPKSVWGHRKRTWRRQRATLWQVGPMESPESVGTNTGA